MKQIIKLTESDLHRIIKSTVKRIIKEEWESPLDRIKKSKINFDNVQKIDLPERKPRVPKSPKVPVSSTSTVADKAPTPEVPSVRKTEVPTPEVSHERRTKEPTPEVSNVSKDKEPTPEVPHERRSVLDFWLEENRIRRVIKESMNRVLIESVPGGMEVTEENIDSVIGNICEYEISDYGDFLCVEVYGSYKAFNACSDALKQAFGKQNVTGDGQMNSIYVKY